MTRLGLYLIVSAYFLYTPYLYGQNQPSARELNALGELIAELQSSITATRQQRDSILLELETSERNILESSQQIARIEADIAQELQELDALQNRRALLQDQRQEQQALISQYMRNAYRNGREEYLKLLLNQESISQSSRVLRYYQYFNEARAERIEAFNTTLDQLTTVESNIESSSRRLQEDRENLLARQASLRTEQGQRQTLLNELDTALDADSQELARLQQEREEMEQLIEELSRAIAELSLGDSGENFAELRGRLPWPVVGPLLNSYGARYALGDLNWQGVIIAANEGADVRAIHHGRVVYADWFGNSGLLLIIDHGDGYMSLYAHNQLLYKQLGDWVNAGEVIAAIGNTGGRREFGVYFEIRQNGASQNPLNWLMARP